MGRSGVRGERCSGRLIDRLAVAERREETQLFRAARWIAIRTQVRNIRRRFAKLESGVRPRFCYDFWVICKISKLFE